MLEELFLKTLPNLGVGIAAVVVLYLCFKVAIDALNKRDDAFRQYVEANNHKSVEVMTECRDAIKAAAENIRQSTEIQRQVVEHLIKEK
jgi:uncharacterized membrane protein